MICAARWLCCALCRGISCKTIIGCAVPFHLKEKFKRVQFMEADPKHWLPELYQKG